MSSSESDEVETIVIDNGSGTIRAGFAGDDAPRSIVSTVIGHASRSTYQLTPETKDYYIGSEAQRKRGVLNLNYPIEHGIVTNWDDMETIWQYVFCDELKVNPRDHGVLMGEPPLNPKGNRERMTQVMFETFNVPGFSIAMQSRLSLYASGRGSGVVVDVGDGISHVAVIYEGYGITHATRRVDFAGKDLTTHLQSLLQERGYDFVTASEMEIVREMKERMCYVAEDFDQELSKSELEKSYELPDGTVINIGSEMFRCPEILFKPIPELQFGGIQDMINSSLQASGVDTTGDLSCNIIMSGGTTTCPGFVDRLKKELEALTPKTRKMKIVAPPERKFSVWIGASILGSLSLTRGKLIQKSEYEEYGPSIVHRKCL